MSVRERNMGSGSGWDYHPDPPMNAGSLERVLAMVRDMNPRELAILERTLARTADVKLLSPVDVVAYAWPMLDPSRERYLAIGLATDMRPVKVHVTDGGVSFAVCCVRATMRAMLTADRPIHGIVLVHNHPSGDPNPSRADVESTHAMHTAACALGMQVTDHVVIGSPVSYVSMQANGDFRPARM